MLLIVPAGSRHRDTGAGRTWAASIPILLPRARKDVTLTPPALQKSTGQAGDPGQLVCSVKAGDGLKEWHVGFDQGSRFGTYDF